MSLPTDSEILPRVIEEFGAVFRNKGLKPPPLAPETALDGSLGLESLDFAELVVRLEEAFGKDPFSNGTIPEVRTLGDLCALY
jgi:acyl carrier protein